MESIAKVNCQFRSIELLELVINPASDERTESRVYNYEVNIEHRTTLEKETMYVICSIIVRNEEKELEYGKVKSSCVFQLYDLIDHINQETKQLKLPEQFIIAINSIVVSTTRGIMFASFRGTHLHNAVLPIVDPKIFG